jgi:hypothetical protein
MQASLQEQIDSRSEPSPMAIIGVILAQGAIRWLDKQKREQQATSLEIRKNANQITRQN